MKTKTYNIIRTIIVVFFLALVCIAMPTSVSASEQEDYSGNMRYSGFGDDGRKVAYALMAEAVKAVEESVFIPASSGCTVSDIHIAFDGIRADLPECFMVDSFVFRAADDGSGWWVSFRYSFEGEQIPREEALQIKEKIDCKISEILASVPETVQTDYEKALFVHDYLAENISYEWVGSHQTIYGALVEGKCVCAGYGKAYTVLMRKLGVKTWYITGYADTGERHGWNVSWIDGDCVYTDVTWDDIETGVKYEYFNISGEEMEKDHFMDDIYASILGPCSHSDHKFKPGPQKAMYINLRVTELSFNQVGESVQLDPIVGPENTVNKAVVYTSSDPSVARVDENGTVTAIGEGTAVITANSADGGATASCSVVVKYSVQDATMAVTTNPVTETTPCETTPATEATTSTTVTELPTEEATSTTVTELPTEEAESDVKPATVPTSDLTVPLVTTVPETSAPAETHIPADFPAVPPVSPSTTTLDPAMIVRTIILFLSFSFFVSGLILMKHQPAGQVPYWRG